MSEAVASALALVQAPTTRTVLGSRLWLWLALALPLYPLAPRGAGAPFLLLYNLLLGALFVWDRARLGRVKLSVVRSALNAPPRARDLRWFAHESLDYSLELTLREGPGLRLSVAESAPLGFSLSPAEQRGQLTERAPCLFAFRIHSSRHGSAAMTHAYVRRESALGLCALIESHPCPSQLAAYPRLAFTRAPYPMLAPRHAGRVAIARRGAEQGGEVEHLRAYTATDPMRSIDWKASAKRRRPITRAYQPERSQTLWVVLDASRGMMAPSDDGAQTTRFEAALEASLYVASAALAEGDQVGLLVYGRAHRLSVAPKRGRAHLFTLIEALLSVHPEPCELDAAGLLTTFAREAPKRALFAFFTDFDNGADLEQLAEHAHLLTRRHLALCVGLTNLELTRRLSSAIESERDAYRKVAASHLADERERLKHSLQKAGLYVIESAPRDLAEATLAEYRRKKRSGRL